VFSQTDYLLLQRQPSRFLGVVLVLASLLAAFALYRSAMPGMLAAGMMLVLAGYALWVWPRQVSLRHASSVTGLRFDSEGWHVLRRDGSEASARLLADTFVSAFLTVVRLREPGRWWPVSVVLPPDAAAEEALRRLRLRLRFSRQRWVAAE
jgi:toxin CptA|tara:strand:- start:523 stop:975 length:453 start_codon:yes stop_codon:yes gene_type:complete